MVRPFILLQLTDLHFGRHSRFHGQDMAKVARDCAAAIANALKTFRWAEAVELVLVTGDVAEMAHPDEYGEALAFFAALRSALRLAPRRFVFVPGNHDISWTKCKEALAAIEPKIEERTINAAGREQAIRTAMDKVKLLRFDEMVAQFYGSSPADAPELARSGESRAVSEATALAAGAYVHDLPELLVSVAALNSCERESHRDGDHRGLVSKVQAQEVLDHWLNDAPTERLRLIAVHHNPITSPVEQVNESLAWVQQEMGKKTLSPEELQELVARFTADVGGFDGHYQLRRIASQAQVSLLLHGHHHTDDHGTSWSWGGNGSSAKGNMLIVSAGSWSLVPQKLSSEQPAVMQLVRIDPQQQEATVRLLRYDPHASLAGNVTLGAFVPDGKSLDGGPLQLSIPERLRKAAIAPAPQDDARAASEPLEAPKAAASSRAVEAAVKKYRKRTEGRTRSWKARGVGSRDRGKKQQPVEADLDSMYVPIEVAPWSRTDRGLLQMRDLGRRSMAPEDIFARERAMVLVGAAGSGKTIWMTWTFRRLLERADALPFFLELRALAKGWNDPMAARRTIDAVLEHELDQCGIDSAREVLRGLLAKSAKSRPVLLVDGWDELGELGTDFRKRLDEFRGEHPHVLVVVSSRPYGEDRPAEAAGFDTFEIQPLSDESIKRLAYQFHHRVDGDAESEAAAAAAELLTRLKDVPAARELARTPLLLTMLMLLNRKQPLPDKRHRLYDACLRNLLHAWPAQREKGGAQPLPDEWRPEDHGLRLEVVSKVAYELQTGNSRGSPSAAIIARRSAVVSMLPADWLRDQREGFVEWLINSAGVLTDRTDDTITFAHLSFQEFLAAYYLHCTKAGDECISAMVEHAARPQWQESLRQWAGLLHDQESAELGPIFAALSAQPATTWLAGAILADGSGQDQDVIAWARGLDASQIASSQGRAFDCARAWASSRQADRKPLVASSLAAVAKGAMWLDAVKLEEWCEAARLEWQRPQVLQELAAPWEREFALARSRATLGASWLVPGHGAGVLLRLWPSQRSHVSITLQTLLSVGGSAESLKRVAKARLVGESTTTSQDSLAMAIGEAFVRDVVRDFGRAFGRDVGRDFGRALGRDVGRALGRALGRAFVRDVVRDVGRAFVRDVGRAFGRDVVRAFVRDVVRAFVRDVSRDVVRALGRDVGRDVVRAFVRDVVRAFGRDVVRDFGRAFGRDVVRDFGRDLQRVWSLDDAAVTGLWWPAFLDVELSSVVGRSCVRSILASDLLGPIEEPFSELGLFRLACRASLHPTADSSQLDTALATYRGDPLWPALARHLSRRSTPEDRALLEELARHPEKREGVLSWCLRYYVRGDLLLQDGTVLTIDDLCHQLGIEPPPLLEDLPDELPLPVPTELDSSAGMEQ